MSLIPALVKQNQVNLYEFEASLLYRVSSIHDYTEKLSPKKIDTHMISIIVQSRKVLHTYVTFV